jgi:hypothetical protein
MIAKEALQIRCFTSLEKMTMRQLNQIYCRRVRDPSTAQEIKTYKNSTSSLAPNSLLSHKMQSWRQIQSLESSSWWWTWGMFRLPSEPPFDHCKVLTLEGETKWSNGTLDRNERRISREI